MRPVAPSIDSRIRSACPLWRAYSSIMCTRIQRRLRPSPVSWRRRIAISSSDAAARSPGRRPPRTGRTARAAPRAASRTALCQSQSSSASQSTSSNGGCRRCPSRKTCRTTSPRLGQVLEHPAEGHRRRRQRGVRAARRRGPRSSSARCRDAGRGSPAAWCARRPRRAPWCARRDAHASPTHPGFGVARRDAVRRPGRVGQHREVRRARRSTVAPSASCRRDLGVAVVRWRCRGARSPAAGRRRPAGAAAGSAGRAAAPASGTPAKYSRLPLRPAGQRRPRTRTRARRRSARCPGRPGRRGTDARPARSRAAAAGSDGSETSQ